MPSDAATLDRPAVAALADTVVSWRDKAMPPSAWGRSVSEVLAGSPRLSDLPTPLLTLSAPGLAHNVATLAAWCAERGLDLAPHGKTTMAPALWAAQLDAGAWAVTVANQAQLAVARAFGVTRSLVANPVISRIGLRWIADQLAADEATRIIVWADSERTVELMAAALDGHPVPRPVDVLVDVGGSGGRTGARDAATALAVARAVAATPALRLAGVAGYEAALAHGTDSLDRVRGYLRDVTDVHTRIRAEGLYPDSSTPIVSAGGSAYFDLVADALAPLTLDGARVVLRSGAYITHDDGLYRDVSPLGAHPRTEGDRLVPAMHGWVRITSQPEPGLALFDAGRRDLPYDSGLPEPQLLRPRSPGEPVTALEGCTVSAFNDQHGFLRFPPDAPAPVRIGDELRLGLSHPCTAFDKWGLIPVIDDPGAPDPRVVDLIRTFF